MAKGISGQQKEIVRSINDQILYTKSIQELGLGDKIRERLFKEMAKDGITSGDGISNYYTTQGILPIHRKNGGYITDEQLKKYQNMLSIFAKEALHEHGVIDITEKLKRVSQAKGPQTALQLLRNIENVQENNFTIINQGKGILNNKITFDPLKPGEANRLEKMLDGLYKEVLAKNAFDITEELALIPKIKNEKGKAVIDSNKIQLVKTALIEQMEKDGIIVDRVKGLMKVDLDKALTKEQIINYRAMVNHFVDNVNAQRDPNNPPYIISQASAKKSATHQATTLTESERNKIREKSYPGRYIDITELVIAFPDKNDPIRVAIINNLKKTLSNKGYDEHYFQYPENLQIFATSPSNPEISPQLKTSLEANLKAQIQAAKATKIQPQLHVQPAAPVDPKAEVEAPKPLITPTSEALPKPIPTVLSEQDLANNIVKSLEEFAKDPQLTKALGKNDAEILQKKINGLKDKPLSEISKDLEDLKQWSQGKQTKKPVFKSIVQVINAAKDVIVAYVSGNQEKRSESIEKFKIALDNKPVRDAARQIYDKITSLKPISVELSNTQEVSKTHKLSIPKLQSQSSFEKEDRIKGQHTKKLLKETSKPSGHPIVR